jgi:hypothetical protein
MVLTPEIQWRPVSIGPEVLLNEGTAISSVLAGPKGRIYYGTSNPLGDTSVIGWYNFASHHNQWQDVPPTTAFPAHAGINNAALNISESSYWGAVDLVVSGMHTVWYRHWGYVGGWTSSNVFVPGDYAIPGPTVTFDNYTASVYTSFQGSQLLRMMHLSNRQMQSYPLPSSEDPAAIAFGKSHETVWLLTADTLWSFNTAQDVWTPVMEAASGDFFVAMGHMGPMLWVLNADGGIAEVHSDNRVTWVAQLHLSPLSAEPDGVSGLWIASLRHLTLWIPGKPQRQWLWPTLRYPSPASQWSSSGSSAPPDWPPIPHLAVGAGHSVDIGYGTYIGQASFASKRVTVISRPEKTPARRRTHESR